MNVVWKIIPIFARKMKEVMGENRYPIIEEETGIDMCCEPPVGYAATGSGYANTVETDVVDVADSWDPGIGPYNMEDLNARMDEAEAYIAKAEQGDWSDWVTESQSRANLYSKYPWLR
jgi:hypothetical protein